MVTYCEISWMSAFRMFWKWRLPAGPARSETPRRRDAAIIYPKTRNFSQTLLRHIGDFSYRIDTGQSSFEVLRDILNVHVRVDQCSINSVIRELANIQSFICIKTLLLCVLVLCLCSAY